MNKSLKLGVSGDKGSFSEKAGLLYAKNTGVDYTLHYLMDMKGVLAAIENTSIDVGIFPVVNMHGGLVRMAFDAMGQHYFQVIDELWLNVQQCLLAKFGIKKHDIKKIVSHSQALAQCRFYIEKNFPKAELIEWQDTALAAKNLSEGTLAADCAVIAPELAASLYTLDILDKHIQDIEQNLTAFIIVKHLNKSGES